MTPYIKGEPQYEASPRWFHDIDWKVWLLSLVGAYVYSRSRDGVEAANHALGVLLCSLALSFSLVRLLQIRFKQLRSQLWMHLLFWFAVVIAVDSFALPRYRYIPYSILPTAILPAVERFFDNVNEYANEIFFFGCRVALLYWVIRWVGRRIRKYRQDRRTSESA